MKKVISIILCMSLFIMCTLPVSAAEVMPKENVMEKEEISAIAGENYFSKILPKLNSVNGTESNVVNFSPGSTSGGTKITSMSFNVRALGDSFVLYIQAPDGTIYSFLITENKTITIDNFNSCNPSDTWKIWIKTLGAVSTASITAKISYSY